MERLELLFAKSFACGVILLCIACSESAKPIDECSGRGCASEGGDDDDADGDAEGDDDDDDVEEVIDAGRAEAGGGRDAREDDRMSPRVDAALRSDGGTLDAGEASEEDAGGEAGTSVDAADASRDVPSTTLPPVTDYSKPGPFKTTSTANTGPDENYTIYRPEPLGENDFVHPPIIFGPGILTTANSYRNLLNHLASHGFVTICVNSMSGGPNAPGNLEDMKVGLEWLIAQNDAPGVFQGKLAVDRAVAMGYSIGATASVQLSSHEAVTTTVVIHGHNTMGDPKGPVLMITGTMDVIGDMRKTLATLEEAPAVLVALPIGHLDVLTELAMSTTISATTRYVAPITAWLRYWVHGDEDGKRFFWGDACEMCESPWITPEPNAKWKAQML